MSEAADGGLQSVEGVTQVPLGSEDDGLQAALLVAHVLHLTHLLKSQQNLQYEAFRNSESYTLRNERSSDGVVLGRLLIV